MKRAPRKVHGFLPGVPTLMGGAAIALLTFVLVAVAANAAPDRLPYRTRLLGHAVSGQSPDSALTVLDAAEAQLEGVGLRLRAEGRELPLPVTLTDPTDLGLSVTLVGYDREATGARLASLGHSGDRLRDLMDRFRAFYFGIDVAPAVDVDPTKLNASLDDLLRSSEQPAVNARYTHDGNTLMVLPDAAGSVYDRTAILTAIHQRLAVFDLSPIAVVRTLETPRVTATSLTERLPEARRALARAPLTLTFGDQRWEFDSRVVVGWLTESDGRHLGLTLDAAAVRTSIAPVSDAVAVAVKNPRFTLANGRVTEFVPAESGRTLDETQTLAGIADALLGSGNTTVAVATRTIEPEGGTGDTNTLGITELVAEGRTNFAGSPTNRRFNIAVGASKLNGIIIKPGETFSLVHALVPIDAKGGYRQELVIKGNRTIPEFGGGLCQIGTTMFRLVMNAGLPILERQNHSYRVRYYEPPVGKDATIYDPKPDFRFTNDYRNPLLLTTAIEGNDLVFRFYGTKEKRDIVQTTPRLFNIVAPPPKKTIESTDIPVGTTKCLEHAHPGSDAEFTYRVTYADGSVKSQVFKSHYRPWQEYCLIGVKSLPKTDTSGSGMNTNTNSGAGTPLDTNAAPVDGTNPADSLPN